MNITSKSNFAWWDIVPYTVFYDFHESLREQFKDSFEGKIRLTGQTLLPNLMVELGIHKTTSEAMRAGFKGAIPNCEYVYYKVPKHNYRKRFYCYMPTYSMTKVSLISALRLAYWYFFPLKK